MTRTGSFAVRRAVPPTPAATIDFVIDGQNRRVGKRLGGTFTRGWVYDGPRIVAELDASGAVLSRFYYGVNGHAPEAMVRAGPVPGPGMIDGRG